MDIDSKSSLWYEILDNVDLVMGMKNIFELEGMINSQDSCFSFLSRLIPFFLRDSNSDCTKNAKDG